MRYIYFNKLNLQYISVNKINNFQFKMLFQNNKYSIILQSFEDTFDTAISIFFV